MEKVEGQGKMSEIKSKQESGRLSEHPEKNMKLLIRIVCPGIDVEDKHLDMGSHRAFFESCLCGEKNNYSEFLGCAFMHDQ